MVLPVQKGFTNQTENKSADEVETSYQPSLVVINVVILR